MLLQNSKIDRNLLSGIFDVNKEKFNKFTPHSKIKILDEYTPTKLPKDCRVRYNDVDLFKSRYDDYQMYKHSF